MKKICIILDFSDAKVKHFEYDSTEDIEELLTETYNFQLSSIEYMTVDKLIIEQVTGQ